ncbi:MAG: hypothetical protein JWO38_3985 [Gemmataceae bacterium]|nr:hypothetical protein [Gemmataceae bacterium]
MTDPPDPPPPEFPFGTAIATLVTLFLFFGLVLVAYYSPNYLGDVKGEPKTDPATKLKEVQARNQAVLEGTDPSAKMSVGQATAEVLAHADKTKDGKNKYGHLPFPAEPKPAAPEKK